MSLAWFPTLNRYLVVSIGIALVNRHATLPSSQNYVTFMFSVLLIITSMYLAPVVMSKCRIYTALAQPVTRENFFNTKSSGDVSASPTRAQWVNASSMPTTVSNTTDAGQSARDHFPSRLTFSIVIPAQNEEGNIAGTVRALHETLTSQRIPFEIIVVNDHSVDGTEAVLRNLTATFPGVRYINNLQPKGFGQAIRAGLDQFRGDAVCIVMADASDDPHDVVTYYRKLEGGYECVFGSRFMRGSRVIDYPIHKLVINRIANAFIKVFFRLPLNDTTNAFKAYRRDVIRGISPIVSPHFNITVELPLKAIIRGYTYSIVPISWYNRKVGFSKLKIREMGSRYLFVVLIAWLEQKLVRTDYRRSDAPVISPESARMRAVKASNGSSAGGAKRIIELMTPLLRLAVCGIPVIMLSMILWGIWNRTPHVLFWDEWQNVDMVLHFKQGTLQFQDFWAFHNEHRIVIPRMLDLGLILLTHWNEQLMMTVDLALSVGEALLLLAAVRRSLNSTNWMFALTAPLALLIFSFGQYENWLWSFQITFICTVLGVALCVFAFARNQAAMTWGAFLLALIGAFLAAWSSVGGTLAWIAFAPAAWRSSKSKGAIWTIAGVAVLVTYFQGFPHQAGGHIPLTAIAFALGYLGAPLSALSVKLALIAGCVSVVFVLVNLGIYWFTRGLGVTLDTWFCLALFVLGVDGVTTIGRYGMFGFNDLLTSRYQIYSALWWVAVVVLAAINIQGLANAHRTEHAAKRSWGASRAFQAINAVGIVACCLVMVYSNAVNWSVLKDSMYAQRLDEICVANYQYAPNACLHGFVWDPAYLRTQAAILDQYHLSIFTTDTSTTRPLIQYFNQTTGDYWTTTTLVDTGAGYKESKWIGLVFVNPHTGAQPLYQCLTNDRHTHFLSLSEGCDHQSYLGTEGWVYTGIPTTDSVTPLYECADNATSFAWTDSGCNGKSEVTQLGYISTRSFPWVSP